jgi:hypothetical protein
MDYEDANKYVETNPDPDAAHSAFVKLKSQPKNKIMDTKMREVTFVKEKHYGVLKAVWIYLILTKVNLNVLLIILFTRKTIRTIQITG